MVTEIGEKGDQGIFFFFSVFQGAGVGRVEKLLCVPEIVRHIKRKRRETRITKKVMTTDVHINILYLNIVYDLL